ncbi:MAG: sigma 54-interacting transcriptional regulator [Candidatus Hydrogenedentes bacterium]|nr:sigma 54-interacting transcriptional regulator [Candidatus Hydrogenedentota bacterium]
MNSDYALTITRGTQLSRTWPLSAKVKVIGRSTGCNIRIVDATISRRHCEVWVEDGIAWVRDLESSNDTLLNGVPITKAKLSTGDEIQIGKYSLALIQLETAFTPKCDSLDDSTPATLALSDGYYVNEAEASRNPLDISPRESKFRELLRSHRAFAECTGVAALLAALSPVIASHFGPEAWWLVTATGVDRRLVAHPLSATPTVEADLIRNIQQAIQSKSGVLMPRRREYEGRPSFETSLIAPLMIGEEQLGALALRSGTPNRLYDESDLEFFLGLAHSFAPYLCIAEQTEQLRRDVNTLRGNNGAASSLIGSSAGITEVRSMAARAARSDLPVLILGETGTGKEVVARMIHELSGRAKHAYVIVNAPAIPRELFESEMFGHEKGAFTGATRQKIGYFEDAHNGTMFLDEIGDLAPEHQARMLRVIETGKFNRVGGTREIGVDARIVSATNRNLHSKGADFRQDLFHRLSGFVITIPPLRDRASDIPDLAHHFLNALQRPVTAARLTLSSDAMNKISAYTWPGNVRELKSCMERAAVLAQGDVIEPDDIMISVQSDRREPDSSSHLLTLADAERHHIQRILKRHNGNIKSAAQALKISRVTLYKKISDFGIQL